MIRTVLTFAELRQWAEGFAKGHFQVLVAVGNPGLGKSRLLKQVLRGQARVIEGRTTAFQLYRELYRHLNEPFIIDDVDDLYADRNAVRLLKILCQTEEVKEVAWHSAAKELDVEEIPREFETRTRVVIIANEWKALNKNIGAIEDRGILIRFEPTAEEVHAWVGEWYRDMKIDDDIYHFIEQNLHLIPEASARDYLNAQAAKNAGLEWQEVLCETWGLNQGKLVVIKLLADAGMTQEERVVEFRRQTGQSRATFFRLVGKLRPAKGKTA